MKRFRNIFLILFGISAFLYSAAQNEIVWKEQIVIEGTSKYVRLCKVTKGVVQGDLIMTYFKSDHSAPFGMRRSKDDGRTWSDETIFMRNDDQFYYVNPGILQLEDGRLMLSYCKRGKDNYLGVMYEGPCVKYSSDGGYTWGDETFICWGGSYEPTAIQVPNDKNKDGNKDIYIFWSLALIDQSIDISIATRDNAYSGFACGVAASYDNGASWENFMPTKLGARIVHRNFDEPPNGTFFGSKGNMPTPVLLPNHRIGVVCEAVDKANSPWFTVSNPGDWDWSDFQNQNWTSYQYFGYPPYNADDDTIYPNDPNHCWRPTFTDDTFGGAPYVCVLPNGRIAFSQNSGHVIKVFVCDANGKNQIQQEDPFGNTRSFYSCIIPLNEKEVIIAAHDPENMAATYLRIGEIIKDVEPPTVPQHVSVSKQNSNFQISWEKSTDNIVVHKYEVYAKGKLVATTLWDNEAEINELDSDENYSFEVRAIDYQGNFSGLSTGIQEKPDEEEITLFPNPAVDWITLRIPWNDAAVSIFNTLGELKLNDEHFSSGQFSILTLEKGMYFLEINHNSKTICRKFIKI